MDKDERNAALLEATIDDAATEIADKISAAIVWGFIRLAFLADHFECKTRVCENPDCPTPYFLAVRKGQKFCSHPCAVLVNVRKFREREKGRGRKNSETPDRKGK